MSGTSAAGAAASPGTSSTDDSAAGPRIGAAPSVGAGPDRFVAAVRRQMPDLAVDRRDEEIADLGGEACSSIRNGHRDNLGEYGISAVQAEQLRRVARADLCP